MLKALRASKYVPCREAKRASLESLAHHSVLGFKYSMDDKQLTADPAGEQNTMKASGEGLRLTHRV